MAYVYLGDLGVRDIEREHGFEFSDEEREFLDRPQHHRADFDDGDVGWHMFDIPTFLAISHGEVGERVLRVFMAHNGDYKFQFGAGYANSREGA